MFSHFFIDRPIFATVLSVVIVIVGVVGLATLPVAQYPEVAPPTIQVTATYPGANAKIVSETVAAPIEQEINGVENMLYMNSKCTNDGQMLLDVTFNVGTDLNMAQVLVQNRVAIAEAKLPEEVKRQGVTTKKKSPAILLCVNLVSPDKAYNQLYLSNYAGIRVKDALARLPGVGDVSFLGARDYSMRIWLDPTQLASRGIAAGDVLDALREQNVQVAAGRIGQPPAPEGQVFQYPITTLGRLLEKDEFENIIVKTGEDGRITRIKDIGRAELGAKNYDVNSYLDGDEAVTLAVFQLPGSNALATADAVREEMDRLQKDFPKGVEYQIVYDTTVFVEESIHEVFKTLYEAIVLVFIVVLVFLQNWRTTIIPMIAVPVSLVGTFAVMAGLGFSLNNLSLFGLVLAIGIVVDDAIVVVENVERNMALGLGVRDATRQAMKEVSGPVVAIALVLCAVFVPTAFITGITGEFFRQFALTIAASTVISAFNSLTLSPALCAILLKSHGHGGHQPKEVLPPAGVALVGALVGMVLLTPWLAGMIGLSGSGHGEGHGSSASLWSIRILCLLIGAVAGWIAARPVNMVLAKFFDGFNWLFDRTIAGYGRTVGLLLRLSAIVLMVYAGLMVLTYAGFKAVPIGFIPEQDKGYLVVNAQLPDGASLERSDAVVRRLNDIVLATEGVGHVIAVPGYSVLTSSNISNVGGMFVILEPFEERKGDPELSASAVASRLREQFQQIQEAQIVAFGAPPIDGLGSTGGFKLQVQDRGDLGFVELQKNVQGVIEAGSQQPGLVGLFSSFSANQPQLFVDVDRTKAKSQGLALSDVFETLQVYLGSAYANDFTFQGRNWQVNVQADAQFRSRLEDIGGLRIRNAAGQMIPLASVVQVTDSAGPAIVNRYQMYPAAEITGGTAPGVSSGQAIAMMEQLAGSNLAQNMGIEWTELTLQQIKAGEDLINVLVFPLAVVFVFLVLAAQYESWSLPMAIILIVPMCLLAAMAGVWLMGMDNNIFTQIGLVVLIALASKNAILIVEFAKEQQGAGKSRYDATVDACRLRLRPILMTSLAFILGVVPLLTSAGAGAEMRVALGVGVFSGMLGVTLFGIFFTPVFYSTVMGLSERRTPKPQNQEQATPTER
ncbi:MAG: efflux RND transporter permease subunit [Thermoguttaceae bacterium]